MAENRQNKGRNPVGASGKSSDISALDFIKKTALSLSLMLIAGIACLVFIPGKAPDTEALLPTSAPEITAEAAPTPAPTLIPTDAAPPPTETVYPTPSCKPSPASYATIGAIGDIMVMESQIDFARRVGNGGYDFSRSFLPLHELFESVDLMCGNLETTFNGDKITYYDIVRDDGSIRRGCRFSAPDELASNLKQAGFDVITTANNHSFDTGWEGLRKTVEVVRAAGLLQTGTFLSPEDRNAPLITDVNGIKIGIIACLSGTNGHSSALSGEQQSFAFASLRKLSELKSDIERTRAAGAEFIVAFLHWGIEFTHSHSSSQTRTAELLAEAGVDAIFGAHSHFVQPIEWLTVQRDDCETAVPVIYSLGNFISNMSPTPRDYGMFVKLGLKKQGGKVEITDLAYLPLWCFKQQTEDGVLHQVLPCCEDVLSVTAWGPLTEANYDRLRRCREYVADIVGEDAARLMTSVER